MEAELKEKGFSVHTDKTKFDFEVIHGFLKHSYWAKDVPIEIIKKSIDNSLCFGVFHKEKQIGFARIVTDYTTFAYVADVFILEAFRKMGLSKLLMKTILEYPELKKLRRWMLATKDAHGLYSQFGFRPLKNPERFMEIHDPEFFKR
jgi:GNAT superfamily N-acetyltransferase